MQKANKKNLRSKPENQMKFPTPGFNGVFQSLNPKTETFFSDLGKTQPPCNAIQKPVERSTPLQQSENGNKVHGRAKLYHQQIDTT